VVIIAHRLATIKNVDTVYVIEEGKVVEQGLFEELKDKKHSRLRYLLDLQSL
jgi:subfamily B ATP-binding cassette protein MsbA